MSNTAARCRLLSVVVALAAWGCDRSGSGPRGLDDPSDPGADAEPGADAAELADDGVSGSDAVAVAVAVPAGTVVVNELIWATADSRGDWIELSNPSDAPVVVEGWYIQDELDAHSYVLPPGTSIAAGGLLLLRSSTAGVTSPLVYGFALNERDTVRLFSADGELRDRVRVQVPRGRSQGRFPDGIGSTAHLSWPTPGEPNSGP